MKVTICWCFNEHGVPAIAVRLPDGGGTLNASPCPVDGHPGTVSISTVDTKDGSQLAADIANMIEWVREPHDCLPSPICEVCGREAGSVEQSMRNAVMRGRLGDGA